MSDTTLDPTTVHLQADQPGDWWPHFWGVFGARGTVALAWWTGALFAQQLRERQRSFPLLSVVGEPGAGKASLIEFLQALVGRPAYVGFDPACATRPAISQVLYGVENLPVVLLPYRGTRLRCVTHEELKQAYQGRPVRVLGRAVGTERTEQFRGALLLAQQETLLSDPGYAARTCELQLSRGEHTAASLAALVMLASLQPYVHTWLGRVRTDAAELIELHSARVQHHFGQLRELDVVQVHDRVALNHAQLAGLVELLPRLVPIQTRQLTAALGTVYCMAASTAQALPVLAAA